MGLHLSYLLLFISRRPRAAFVFILGHRRKFPCHPPESGKLPNLARKCFRARFGKFPSHQMDRKYFRVTREIFPSQGGRSEVCGGADLRPSPWHANFCEPGTQILRATKWHADFCVPGTQILRAIFGGTENLSCLLRNSPGSEGVARKSACHGTQISRIPGRGTEI